MRDSQETDSLKQNGKVTGTFYFKKFKVEDNRSTMKVGTDAVLLGAVAEVTGAKKILDIGTGCGVIALMLTQRSDAVTDAIDIDEESVKQARENVAQSLWKDRITVIHSSLQEFAATSEKRYDLVVSNPPYFSKSLKSPSEKRNISRHNDELSFSDLIFYSRKLLEADASLWVILPVKESEEFIGSALRSELFIHTKINLFSKPGRGQHRIILELKKIHSSKPREDILNIKNSNGCYSEEYKRLTKDFYLDF